MLPETEAILFNLFKTKIIKEGDILVEILE